MNTRTNAWAAIIANPNAAEAVQRIAFSFGYRWPVDENNGTVRYKNEASALIFNPENKLIQFLPTCQNVEDYVCQVCKTLDEVVNLFHNPPVRNRMEEVGCIKVFSDGSIRVANTYTVTSENFDKVIDVRNKLMDKKQKLPVVRFRYHSPTSGGKVRRIALVGEDDVYLNGLDLEDGNQFKQFRKNRLEVGGSIWFDGLKEV